MPTDVILFPAEYEKMHIDRCHLYVLFCV